MSDLVDLLIGKWRELSFVDLGAMRPRTVRMWKIGLPADIVDIELIDKAHADWVVDETAQNSLPEHVGGSHPVGEALPRPARVTLLNVLSPLQEVRDPPDVPLGEREHQIGKAPPEVSPQQIAERVDRHHGREPHGDQGRQSAEVAAALGGRTDVQAQDGAHVGACSEEGIPMTRMDGRHLECRWVFRERDGVTPLAGEPTDRSRLSALCTSNSGRMPRRDEPIGIAGAPVRRHASRCTP